MDKESEATVRKLGSVMRLGPARDGRELCVVSVRKGARGMHMASGHRLVCRMGVGRGRSAVAYWMERIATAIAVRSLSRGGLLLHGALAVRDGAGFVLAGPSGVGKSTASRRLPLPWLSLCDDCTLLVRDAHGHYWAHPWPTWSLLRNPGPVGSWPVEQEVPLKALLFLTQSSFDRAEPVTPTPGAALITESAYHLARVVASTPDAGANRTICAKYLCAARALAAAVPAFRLRISLAGRFWDEIERAEGRSKPRMNTDGHGYGVRTNQKSDIRNQKAELAKGNTAGGGGCGDRRNQNSDVRSENAELRKDERKERRAGGPARPPRHLLSGSPRPRLVRFQAGRRTFLRLVRGRRVIASVNDIMREWYVRRPSHRSVRRRTTARRPKGIGHGG
jgi:SynChlorMet cassette protein ScmC